MVYIEVSNQIKIGAELPAPLQKKIESDLSLPNPEYQQALKYGYSTHDKPKEITLYRWEGTNMILPRGYVWTLIKLLKDSKVDYQIQDKRLLLPSVQFTSQIKLRPYQATAVEKLVKYRQGGIVAPCGAGKTAIMLEAMARIGQPSLWITHTKELADQVIERAEMFLGMDRNEIGLIGDGKFSIGERLTVALVQTLARANLDELVDKFGAIFVDEAHHMAARSFFYPVGQFPARYRIWVSATPERADGLTEMVFTAGGSILHEIKQSEVPTIIPELKVIETNYTGFTDGDYPKLINHLINNEERNQLMVETIKSEAQGNYSLVLSDRIEHLEILKDKLEKELPQLKVAILNGSMKKKEREDIMNRVKAKEIHVLLATQLAREGLDITHLNRLFLTTPKRAGAAVQQEVGRIMRPCEGKSDAIVYDFWDNLNPILRSQFWKRREVYKKIGMTWEPKRKGVARA